MQLRLSDNICGWQCIVIVHCDPDLMNFAKMLKNFGRETVDVRCDVTSKPMIQCVENSQLVISIKILSMWHKKLYSMALKRLQIKSNQGLDKKWYILAVFKLKEDCVDCRLSLSFVSCLSPWAQKLKNLLCNSGSCTSCRSTISTSSMYSNEVSPR